MNEISYKEKRMPAGAALFAAELEFSQNKETDKTAKLKMLARTGDSIEHWYWGNVVHDMSGMKLHKKRLTIDYNHNGDEIVGYLNKFDTESGDLLASGVLTPFKDDDRASELIFKMNQGVPYEASINFSDSMVVEEISEGTLVKVNDREFKGPLTIVREWGLRNIAVCPLGADKNTQAELFNNQAKDVVVKVITNGEPKMKTKLTVEEEAVEIEEAAVETEVVEETVEDKHEELAEETVKETVEVKEEVEEEVEVKEEEAVEEEAAVESEESVPLSADRQEFKAMVEEFGKELATEYFSAGITLAQASEKHYSHLKTENAELKVIINELNTKLSNATGIEDSPEVAFIAEGQGAISDPRYKDLSATLGEDLAKFIVGMRK